MVSLGCCLVSRGLRVKIELVLHSNCTLGPSQQLRKLKGPPQNVTWKPGCGAWREELGMGEGVKDFQLKKQEIKSMQARLSSGLKGFMDGKKGEWQAVIKE